jgi:hypothetical protein
MHTIRCFIGKEKIMKVFEGNWVKANDLILPQGFSMIFLTNDLFDDVTELIDSKLDIDYSKYFAYLTPSIYELLVQESKNGKLAYIETEYFGGVGSQSAILFDKGAVKIKPIKTKTYWDEKKMILFISQKVIRL